MKKLFEESKQLIEAITAEPKDLNNKLTAAFNKGASLKLKWKLSKIMIPGESFIYISNLSQKDLGLFYLSFKSAYLSAHVYRPIPIKKGKVEWIARVEMRWQSHLGGTNGAEIFGKAGLFQL